VAVVWIAHTVGLLLLFDPPSALFDGRPLIDQDWGTHYHHLSSLKGHWESGHRLWGYNPFFMAGYPSNTIQDMSIKFFELAAMLTPGLASITAFKLWVFLAFSAIPLVCFAAFRNLFGQDAARHFGGIVATLLGTAYFWNSLPREMLFYGMVGFPIACYVALLALSLLFRTLQDGRKLSCTYLAWLAACIILLPLHLQSVIVLILPGALLLLTHRKPIAYLWTAIGVLLALAINSPWLHTFLSHLPDQASREAVQTLPVLTVQDPLTFLKDYVGGDRYWTFRATLWEKVLRGALLVLGTAGLVRLYRRQRPPLASALLLAVLSCFFLAYFGSFVRATSGLQTMRFKIPLDITLSLCAGHAFCTPVGRKRGMWYRRGAVLLVVVGLGGFVVNLAQTESLGIMKLRTQIRPPVTNIIRWLRTEAPRNARVLFEESGDETGFVYDGMYLSCFLPYWTGHQLIGGPANLYLDRHHFAEFHSGLFLKEDIRLLSDFELKDYLSLYNVGAVVTFHPNSTRRLAALDDFITAKKRIGGIILWTVNEPSGWFLRGSGEVQVGFNRIECTGVQGPEAVLKYHWVDGLQSDPPLQIKPIQLRADPIPFIRILDPPSQFVLSIGKP
jgi:hypothetical protein